MGLDTDFVEMNAIPPSSGDLVLECFYAYGYRGKSMFAVRSPFAMDGTARELIGQAALIFGARYRILCVSRQISGPIAQGEPIGIEVVSIESPATETPLDVV